MTPDADAANDTPPVGDGHCRYGQIIMVQTLPPPADLYFEDYAVGATYECGSFSLTQDEIIAFARQYDPQMMHIDPELAAAGPFGEVIASGWHTISCMMRLFVGVFLPFNGMPAPGIDEVRWLLPVRPNDTLTVYATVEEARRSRSKPDRGLIRSRIEVKNQNGNVALSMKPTNFVRTRNPA
jgi:acyl dehydratase